MTDHHLWLFLIDWPLLGLSFSRFKEGCHPRFVSITILFAKVGVTRELFYLFDNTLCLEIVNPGGSGVKFANIGSQFGRNCLPCKQVTICFNNAAKLPPRRGWLHEWIRPEGLPSCRPFMGFDPPLPLLETRFRFNCFCISFPSLITDILITDS